MVAHLWLRPHASPWMQLGQAGLPGAHHDHDHARQPDLQHVAVLVCALGRIAKGPPLGALPLASPLLQKFLV